MTPEMSFDVIRNIVRFENKLSWRNLKETEIYTCNFIVKRSGELGHSKMESIRLFANFLMKIFYFNDIWIVAAHRNSSPENRITLHNKLWKSLKLQKVPLPDGHYCDEVLHKYSDGIRFSGAVRVDANSAHFASYIISIAHGGLIFLPKQNSDSLIKYIIGDCRFAKEKWIPVEIIRDICRHGGCVVEQYGAYDDREIDMIAIAKKEFIQKITQFLSEYGIVNVKNTSILNGVIKG